jgi:hypothetical protein
MLARQLGGFRPHLMLPQNPDDLLFRKPLPLHPRVKRRGAVVSPEVQPFPPEDQRRIRLKTSAASKALSAPGSPARNMTTVTPMLAVGVYTGVAKPVPKPLP